MKKLLVLLSVMGIAVFFLLSDTDKEELKQEGKRIKKKLKKSHFPKKETAAM
jgi:hypothetical protein